jgi:opacity protein-like surface antigen
MKQIRNLIGMSLVIASFAVTGNARTNADRFEVKAVVGWAGFHNDVWQHKAVAGASYQTRIAGGLRVGPELQFLSGLTNDDRNITLMPTASYEFQLSERLRPYVTGGVGLLRQRESTISGYEWTKSTTSSAGGGVKFDVTRHLFLAPEARFGHQPLARATVGIGYRF